VQRWVGTEGHSVAKARSSPAAPSMIRNCGVFSPRATRSSSTARQAASLSPPMLRTDRRTFCPSPRMPSTTSSEMLVAWRSSRTRTTVPSRISRTMSSSASERWFQASQSAFTRRQVRLPLIRFAAQPLPTAPRNSAPSARPTRRVLVPAR
jgi:hypothetical protein